MVAVHWPSSPWPSSVWTAMPSSCSTSGAANVMSCNSVRSPAADVPRRRATSRCWPPRARPLQLRTGAHAPSRVAHRRPPTRTGCRRSPAATRCRAADGPTAAGPRRAARPDPVPCRLKRIRRQVDLRARGDAGAAGPVVDDAAHVQLAEGGHDGRVVVLTAAQRRAARRSVRAAARVDRARTAPVVARSR